MKFFSKKKIFIQLSKDTDILLSRKSFSNSNKFYYFIIKKRRKIKNIEKKNLTFNIENKRVNSESNLWILESWLLDQLFIFTYIYLSTFDQVCRMRVFARFTKA